VQMLVIQQLEALLNHMQKAILYKGENATLFEDPEFVIGIDRPKLKQLNSQLVEEPGMEIPEGFYKVYEKEIIYDYSLPESLPVKESQRVVTEVLDLLLHDIFGVHFIEPRASAIIVPKIK